MMVKIKVTVLLVNTDLTLETSNFFNKLKKMNKNTSVETLFKKKLRIFL